MKKITTIAIFAIAALAFSCANKSAAVADQKIAIINQYTAKLDSVTTLEEYNAANEQFQLAIIDINNTTGQGVTLESADSVRVATATSTLETKMNTTIEKIQAALQEAMNAAIAADSTANSTL